MASGTLKIPNIPPETPPIPNPEMPSGVVNMPFSRLYATIQQLTDFGKGLGAPFIGQPGTVYRLNDTVSGPFLQENTAVLTNFFARRTIIKGGLAMETHEGMGLVYYQVVCNLNYLLTGDIWYQTDPYYGEGATLVDYATEEFVGWCLVSHPVLKPALAVQLQRFAHIYRPATGVSPDGYANTYQQDAYGMNIENGKAAFNLNSDGDWIPIGLQPVSRAKGKMLEPYVPGMTEATEYFCYVPPIPGYEPLEGDYIQTLDGSRYVVEIPWHLEASVVGNSMLVRRTNAQVFNSGPV